MPDRLVGLRRGSFPATQASALAEFVRDVEPERIRSGGPHVPVEEHDLNRDLRPRNEYLLNNSDIVSVRPRAP